MSYPQKESGYEGDLDECDKNRQANRKGKQQEEENVWCLGHGDEPCRSAPSLVLYGQSSQMCQKLPVESCLSVNFVVVA